MNLRDYEIPETQADVLREVGNIGAGHAATALSKMLDKPVHMTVPRARLVPFGYITDSVGGDEAVVVAVYLRVSGDVPGNLFLIMTRRAAESLITELLEVKRKTDEPFTELECSAISEMGNILSSSYLSSLAEFTALRMYPSVPSLTIDMAGAVLSYGVLQAGSMGDHAVMIDTTFNEGAKDEVEAYFFFIPDPEALDTIFQAMGVPTK